MNTYHDNLRTLIGATLTQLQSESLASQSVSTVAKYKLYYAQGADIIAREQLDNVAEQRALVDLMNAQGVENDNLAANLLAITTTAHATVTAGVANAAIAASNMQKAANAISRLAADIGSVYAMATAADGDTDIYRLASMANNLIRDVANKAENISLLAMNASIKTAEVPIAQLLTEATAVKGDIGRLRGAASAELSQLAALNVTANGHVDTTSAAERVAERELREGNTKCVVIDNALRSACHALNHGLRVSDATSTAVTLAFDEFVEPCQGIGSDQRPCANPRYYALLVPAKGSELLDSERAESIFAEFPHRFYSVQPGGYAKEGQAVPAANLPLTVDSEGKAIVAGSTYVAFLLILLDADYKKYINDFQDLLSLPSAPFTLATTLMAAEQFSPSNPATADPKSTTAEADPKARLQFFVKGPWVKDVEYRCMLLPLATARPGNFVTADRGGKLEFYFDRSIAEQIAPANFTLAQLATTAGSATAATARTPGMTYQVAFDASTTDNFGSPVKPGTLYVPVVLSYAPESPGSTQYINAISDVDAAPVLYFDDGFSIHASQAR